MFLNVSTKFPRPYSPDGRSFLAGDNRTDFLGNLIFPNHDLYLIHIDPAQCAHLLPQTAPELIAFQPGNPSHLMTHTIRNTKQYSYYIYKINNVSGILNQQFPIIKNKYSHPITEIWSPVSEGVVHELSNMPFHEIGMYSSDGTLFASPLDIAAATSTKVILYDTDTWQPTHEFVLSATTDVNHLRFIQSSERLVTAQESAEIWDTNTGERVILLDDGDGRVYHTDASIDASRLLTAGQSGRITEWNLSTGQSDILIRDASPIVFVHYINDETQILYVNDDGTAHVIDQQSNEVVKSLNSSLRDNSFRAVKLTPDEKTLVVGNELWDLTENQKIKTLAEHAEVIEDTQISHDGTWLATRHRDFTARVWKMESLINPDSEIKNYQYQ